MTIYIATSPAPLPPGEVERLNERSEFSRKWVRGYEAKVIPSSSLTHAAKAPAKTPGQALLPSPGGRGGEPKGMAR